MSSVHGDWIRLVNADKAELGIGLTDCEIQRFSKISFKRFVKEKVTANFLKKLNLLKQNHSKSQKLECKKLVVADYLLSPEFTSSQKMLLFRLRSKTLDVRANFPGLHSNNLCVTCGLFPETQSHLLQCSVLISKLQYLCGKTSSLCEDDIYGPTEKQKVIVNIYTDILNAREQLHPSDEGPVHTVIV